MIGLGLGLQYPRGLIGGGFDGLFNQYQNPSLGLSLRRLDGNFNGNIISVRRDNNDVANIGFDSNELDITSLLAFANGGNVFVTDWYGQSSNAFVVSQTVANSQPKIVDAGSLIVENGKPAIQFDGVDDYLFSSSSFPATEISLFITLKSIQNLSNQRFYHIKNGGNNISIHRFDAALVDVFPTLTDNVTGLVPSVDSDLLQNNYTVINSNKLFKNSVEFVDFRNANTGYTGGDGIYLGCRADLTNFSNVKHQEFISYDFDQSANRVGIETNINDFYNIY